MLKHLKHLKVLASAIALCSLVLFGAFIQPQLHNDYLRYEVGQSTVQVLSPAGGGGTGFAMKAASGTNYIVTNKHVCEVNVNGWMIIKQDDGEKLLRRVVYIDNKHDICLVDGDKRFSPLDLGSEPSKGDYHYIIGHPGLRQLTVSQGEFIGYDTVKLLDNVKKREDCRGEIFELNEMERFLYGIEFACVRGYKSAATTAVTYPGNSGSPVVNKYGNVIGILFAGSTEQERDNYYVPLYELKRVLSKF